MLLLGSRFKFCARHIRFISKSTHEDYPEEIYLLGKAAPKN